MRGTNLPPFSLHYLHINYAMLEISEKNDDYDFMDKKVVAAPLFAH